MKIDPAMESNIYQTGCQAAKSVPQAELANSGRGEIGGIAEVLSFSAIVAGARDQLENRTPEECARIADIAEAVRAGSYSVNSTAVVEQIFIKCQIRVSHG